MTTTPIDPFATANQGAPSAQTTAGGDPFASASSAFVKMEDLLGRLLLIYPTGRGERISTLPGQQGKPYEYVVTDTHVLDGPATDKIDAIPAVLDGLQYQGQSITPQLTPKIGRGVPVLGRLIQKPSQTKGFGPAWVLDSPTDADKDAARRYGQSKGLW